MTFKKLTLPQLKKIIRFYNKHVTILLSKVVAGRRRPKTKAELIADMEIHLEIMDNKVVLRDLNLGSNSIGDFPTFPELKGRMKPAPKPVVKPVVKPELQPESEYETSDDETEPIKPVKPVKPVKTTLTAEQKKQIVKKRKKIIQILEKINKILNDSLYVRGKEDLKTESEKRRYKKLLRNLAIYELKQEELKNEIEEIKASIKSKPTKPVIVKPAPVSKPKKLIELNMADEYSSPDEILEYINFLATAIDNPLNTRLLNKLYNETEARIDEYVANNNDYFIKQGIDMLNKNLINIRGGTNDMRNVRRLIKLLRRLIAPKENIVIKPQRKYVNPLQPRNKPPISKKDEFFIFDSEGKNETKNLKGKYIYNNVKIVKDQTDLFPNLGWGMFLPWAYFQRPNGLKDYIRIEEQAHRNSSKSAIEYDVRSLSNRNTGSEGRTVNVFVKTNGKISGLVRTEITSSNMGKKILHWDYVYVNQHFQGKGYAGEELDLLMTYLKDVIPSLKEVYLTYAADTSRGWIAYDNTLYDWGFINKRIAQIQKDNNISRNDRLTEKQADLIHRNIKGTQTWIKRMEGEGMRKSNKYSILRQSMEEMNTY